MAGMLSAADVSAPLYTEGFVRRSALDKAFRSFEAWLRVGLFTPESFVRYVCVDMGVWQSMARGKKSASASPGGAGLPRFVDIQLTAEDRKAFVSLSYSADDVLSALERIIAEGHRVGLSYSGERGAYTASLTGREAGCANEGLCMTSFAQTPLKALALAVYKHTVLTEGVWLDGGHTGGEDFG